MVDWKRIMDATKASIFTFVVMMLMVGSVSFFGYAAYSHIFDMYMLLWGVAIGSVCGIVVFIAVGVEWSNNNG